MLTPSPAWVAAFSRSKVPVRFIVTVDDGTTIHKAASGPNADKYPSGVVDVSPFGTRMDVLTRRQETSAITVTFHDRWIRPIWTAKRLKGHDITVSIGTSALAEADYLPYFTGKIDELLRDEDNTVVVDCVDIIARNFDADVYFPIINVHPLVALKDLLLAIGFVVGDLDLTTFDETADTTRSHWVVTHGAVDPAMGSVGGQLIAEPRKGSELVSELLTILNGHLVADEHGKVRFVAFDSTAPAIAVWTKADYDSVKQTGVALHTFNRVVVTTGANADGEGVLYDQDHDDSQAALGETFTREIVNPWVCHSVAIAPGPDQWLSGPSPGDLDDADFFGRGCAMICGSAVPDDWPDTAQDATAKLTASRTAWLKIGLEVVEATVLDVGAWQRYDLVRNPGAGYYITQVPTIAGCTAKRGALGTSVDEHFPTNANGVFVTDITIAKAMAEATLDRFGYGLHVIEVPTDLSKLPYQVGDIVSVVNDKFLAFGQDGIGTGEKWELVGKEIQAGDDDLSIMWTLASSGVVTGWATTRRYDSDMNKGLPAGMAWAIDNGDLGAPHVETGGDISAATGLHGDIAAAVASSGYARTAFRDTEVPLEATKDNYIYVDTLTGARAVIPVTISSGAPPTPPSYALLGILTTDATDVTGATDGRVLKAVSGQKMLPATAGPAHSFAAEPPNLVLNSDFGSWTNEITDPGFEEVRPPDAWEVSAGTWDTDVGRSATNGSGAYAIEFKNLAVAGSPVSMTGRLFPVEGDTVEYAISAWVRNGANKGFVVSVEAFTAAGSSLGSTDLFNGSEDLKGVFVAKGGTITFGSTARQAAITVTQSTQDYQLLLDRVEAYPLPRRAETQVESDHTAATATWVTVRYKHQLGAGVVWDDTTYEGTIPRHGVYAIQACIEWDTMAGELAALKLQKDDGGGGWIDLDRVLAADVQTAQSMLLATTLYIEQGKQIRIQAQQALGGLTTRTIQGHAATKLSYLRITELRG